MIAALAALSHIGALEYLERLIIFFRTHESFRLTHSEERHKLLIQLLEETWADQRQWVKAFKKRFYVKMPVLVCAVDTGGTSLEVNSARLKKVGFHLAPPPVVKAAAAPLSEWFCGFMRLIPSCAHLHQSYRGLYQSRAPCLLKFSVPSKLGFEPLNVVTVFESRIAFAVRHCRAHVCGLRECDMFRSLLLDHVSASLKQRYLSGEVKR
jgi:hypothetical protein